MFLLFILSFICFKFRLVASQAGPVALASQYALTTSTSMPFPTATLSSTDTKAHLVANWSLGKGRVQDNPENLRFVNDPFPDSPPPGTNSSTSPTSPVLRVTYPKGSYSHDTGGAQLYTLWNTTDGSSFNSMMVTYEVAFDAGFDWVKGGKLPGLRGGLSSSGCSGGNKSDGLECFSSRLMWRTPEAGSEGGPGEVYMYIPTTNGLCSRPKIICNSDYGISIQRDAFVFTPGAWFRITMIVQMNSPPSTPNGNIVVYFNDHPAIATSSLQIRASDNVAANGLYLSTFFGGSDESWSTPVTTYTYFRNIELWGSSAASNLTAEIFSNGASTRKPMLTTFALLLLTFIMGSLFCV